jgi:RND family efflux transporter MFP subunit
MKRTLFILLAVALLGGLIVWRLASNKKVIEANKQVVDRSNVPVAITVANAEKRPISGNLTTTATLDSWTETDISAATAGQLMSLSIDVGSFVSKGQKIGQIDTRLREIGLRQATSTVEKLEKDLQRTRELLEGKAATELNYTELKFNYDNAKLQVEQIQEQIKDAVLTAPASGIISSKRIDVGEFVSPGIPLATITDISRLKAILYMNEKDVYRLSTQQTVKVTCDIFPGQELQGKIVFISPKGDENHNYRVEVALDNPGQKLKAGTYVKVEFDLGASSEAIQIPKACLPEGMKNPYVYVVQSKKAVLKQLTLGREIGEYVEVLSGIQAGETVVESGHINLTDGRPVEISNQ